MDENKIREALRAEAAAVKIPEDLAARTVEAARELGKLKLTDRLRARRDARGVGGGGTPVAPFPRWVAWTAAAAVALVAMFAVGRATTDRRGAAGVQTLTKPTVGVAGPAREGTREQVAPAPGSIGADAKGAPGIAPLPQPNAGLYPPKIVRNADVDVRVGRGRFDAAWAHAGQIAQRHNGFVTNSSAETGESRLRRGNLSMRVPASELEAALSELRALGTVVRFATSGYDVSGQIVDLDARLRTLQAQEAQYLELLKKANTVGETIEVRGRLDQVRQEVESMQAQRQLVQSQVDMSTINASIFEPGAEAQTREPGRLSTAWDKARDNALAVLAGIVYVGGALIPLALVALAAWGAVRLVRRRRAL
jgi:hypothetical protein